MKTSTHEKLVTTAVFAFFIVALSCMVYSNDENTTSNQVLDTQDNALRTASVPQLMQAKVSPTVGTNTTTFNFTVQFFDASFGIAAGGNIYSGAGGIWSTSNSGTTWNLDINTGAEMSAIDFQPVSADSMDVWCVGSLPNFHGVIYEKRMARPAPAAAPRPAPAADSSPVRAFPNPASGTCRISCRLGSPAPAVVRLFDARGRLVRTLAADGRNPAEPSVIWDGRDGRGRMLPAGPYLVRFESPAGTSAGRVVLAR